MKKQLTRLRGSCYLSQTVGDTNLQERTQQLGLSNPIAGFVSPNIKQRGSIVSFTRAQTFSLRWCSELKRATWPMLPFVEWTCFTHKHKWRDMDINGKSEWSFLLFWTNNNVDDYLKKYNWPTDSYAFIEVILSSYLDWEYAIQSNQETCSNDNENTLTEALYGLIMVNRKRAKQETSIQIHSNYVPKPHPWRKGRSEITRHQFVG